MEDTHKSEEPAKTCPLPPSKVIDEYFMEHRAKLIDIAAYLDRLDRSSGARDDFRDHAFRRALDVLADGRPHRAKRILELFSDHSTTLPESAEGMKGASGAAPPGAEGGRA